MEKRVLRERRLTDEEVEHYRQIRDQVAAEMPEIRRRARAAKPRILLKHAVKTLKEDRS